MIEAKGLTKYYGLIPAVDHVSFSIDKGEIVGFLGPNGAGKTTTMRMLTGFAPPSSGSAEIAGFSLAAAPMDVKRRVGYLPESVPLYTEMRVKSFLRYVADVKGVPVRETTKEIERVVARSGLTEVADRTIRNLSRGYRQRVGLAQALIGNPPVLILDEPTVGLDPRQIIEIRGLIKEFAQEHTVLLSTHILPEVAMICRRVIIIHRGRIVAQDTMENLSGGKGSGVLDIEATGPPERIEQTLWAIKTVREVRREGPGRFAVKTTGDDDAREDIIKALTQADLGLRGLDQRARTLEDVFVEAIASEEEVTA